MKTLLLSLMVVAFLYLDSGYTIFCYKCSGKLCNTFENCPNATACSKTTSGGEVVKACAPNCIFPASGEKIEYCAKDKCN
nr:three-finger toxin [Helicops leopardinus]